MRISDWSSDVCPSDLSAGCPWALASALSRVRDSVYTGAMNLIADSAELQAFCARLAKADYITVDTEFLRDSTYWPKLCLLQLAGPEEADVAAFDPLAHRPDLAPVLALFPAPVPVKV